MANRLWRGKKILLIIAPALVLLAAGILYWQKDKLLDKFFGVTDSTIEQGVNQSEDAGPDISVAASGLEIPWEVLRLPGGDLLVTERPGTLKRIGKNSQTYNIEGARHIGEGGLLGMALHPNFASNNYIYLYLTTSSGEGLTNRVDRYNLNGNQLINRQAIIVGIPGASNHDGGRIAFGPDGYLYITTGDAGAPDSAQNTQSLSGKILRIGEDGSIPPDNPFDNEVYSYGHRNPQGLAWDSKKQLWATEHGRSGLQSGLDELNLITRGGNYGWPVAEGDQQQSGMTSPVAHSGPNETWAPASMAYIDGSLFFTGLRGETLYEAKINSDNTVKLRAHFRQDYGRLRASYFGPDKFLYISTSNRDGRGNPATDDDKIIKINPRVFK